MEAESSSDAVDNHTIHFQLREGYIFKSVLDFCAIAFDVLVFRITNKGVFMSADNKKDEMKESILCNLSLPRSVFELWRTPDMVEQDDDAELKIPVDSTNLKNLTTGILKKDVLIIWVDKDDMNTLHLEVQNLEKQRRSSGSVKLIDISSLPNYVLEPVLPYTHDINRPNATVNAADFQKACKSGTQIKAGNMHVQAYPKTVLFSMRNAEVSKSFPFGEKPGNQTQVYDADFVIKGSISAVVKCCNMTADVRIYCAPGAPMMLGMNAGRSGGVFDIHLVPIKNSK